MNDCQAGLSRLQLSDKLKSLGYPEYMRNRINTFKPGGYIAKQLSEMQVVIQVKE
jgi:hypothetical protein